MKENDKIFVIQIKLLYNYYPSTFVLSIMKDTQL